MADLAARNKEHFDNDASSHLSEWAKLIDDVIKEVKARRAWMSKKWTDSDDAQGDIKLLDYACGSGTISKALLPFVTQAVGLDISSGMVTEFNKWARDTGFSTDKLQAYEYNMLAEADFESNAPADLQLSSSFDIVVVSMALHHVSDPLELMKRLGKCLRPGGVCVILDRIPDSTTTKSDAVMSPSQAQVLKTVNEHGFNAADMRQLYQSAGVGHKFDYVGIPHPFEATVFGQDLSITGFIARGELV